MDAPADAEAFSKQYDAQQAAEQAKQTAPPPTPPEKVAALNGPITLPVFQSVLDEVKQWGTAAKHVGQDVLAGGAQSVKNAGNLAGDVLSGGANPPKDVADQYETPHPIWQHASKALDEFTDAVKVKDPNLVDVLTQYAAQVGPAYAVFAKSLGFLGNRLANLGGGAAADATTLPPDAPRFADMLRMAQHTDSKIGDALNAAGPYGLNLLINHLAHPPGNAEQETALEAHLKNAIDGLMPNGLGNELIHAAMITSRQGMRVLSSGVEQGVGHVEDLAPVRVDPMDALATKQAQADMEAARAAPADAPRPPLRQGVDPMDDIAAQKARDDVAATRSAAMAAPAAGPSKLEQDGAISLARAHVAAQNAAGREGSSHDMLTALAQHVDASTPEGKFYKQVFGALADKNLETRIVPPGGSPAHPEQAKIGSTIAGQYNPTEDSTAMYQVGLKNNANFAHTFAHEHVHAATMGAIDNQPEVGKALSGLMDEAAPGATKTLRKADRYGFTNPKEFVAEAESNPRFQLMLKTEKAADGRPLWDHYKEVIGGIFGLSGAVIASPMFDKLLTKEKSGA